MSGNADRYLRELIQTVGVGSLPVYFLAVSNGYHQHDQCFVLDMAENPVISKPVRPDFRLIAFEIEMPLYT